MSAPTPSAKRSGAHILVIDDDRRIRDLLSRYLGSLPKRFQRGTPRGVDFDCKADSAIIHSNAADHASRNDIGASIGIDDCSERSKHVVLGGYRHFSLFS